MQINGLCVPAASPDGAGSRLDFRHGRLPTASRTRTAGVRFTHDHRFWIHFLRTGHHRAQSILRRFGVEATVRRPVVLHNTCEEIDATITALRRLTAQRR